MNYQTNKRQLESLERRIPRHTACVVTGTAEDSCAGPHYRLWEWSCASIFDKQYASGGEPVYHWRFNVLDRPGVTLIVTPYFKPLSVEQAEDEAFRKQNPDWGRTAAEAAEYHAMFHGTSNWYVTYHCLLRVVEEGRPDVHGYFDGHDFCYVHMADAALAQSVLDTLWAAVHGDPRAFAGATHCAFCGHALTDALSSARGYGPDCCEKYGLPRTPRTIPAEVSASARRCAISSVGATLLT